MQTQNWIGENSNVCIIPRNVTWYHNHWYSFMHSLTSCRNGDHQFISWAGFFFWSVAQHSLHKLPVFSWRLPQTSGSSYDVMQTLCHDFVMQGKQNWGVSHHTNNVTSVYNVNVPYLLHTHRQTAVSLLVAV